MKLNTTIALTTSGVSSYPVLLRESAEDKGWKIATIETQEYPLRWQAVRLFYSDEVVDLQVGDEIIIFDKDTHERVWNGRITERRWRGMISGFAYAHRGKMRKDLFILADAANRGNYIAVKRRPRT